MACQVVGGKLARVCKVVLLFSVFVHLPWAVPMITSDKQTHVSYFHHSSPCPHRTEQWSKLSKSRNLEWHKERWVCTKLKETTWQSHSSSEGKWRWTLETCWKPICVGMTPQIWPSPRINVWRSMGCWRLTQQLDVYSVQWKRFSKTVSQLLTSYIE